MVLKEIIRRIIGSIGGSDHLVNRLAETKFIKRGAQYTVRTFLKITERTKKSLEEYENAGGNKKMKEVAINDSKHAMKVVKEMITYDIPQSIKKLFRSLNPKNHRRRDN